jgi:epidermal growth factor receptor substrate 15
MIDRKSNTNLVIEGAMYSNSNTFLGGNSLRPGPQQQYGGSFGAGAGAGLGAGQQLQQQPQPGPFAPQPTGFGQAPLQQQYTGYPGLQPPQGPGQLQPQFTGFSQTPQQGMQSAMPPMPAIPQQYQQQFQQQRPQQQQQPSPFASAPPQAPPQSLAAPPTPVKPQPTGFQEMAASFQGASSAKPKTTAPKKANKVPNIRLSFITAQDQAKFETLFKSAVGDSQTTMTGEKARDLLLRSRLDGDSLSHIW